MAVGEVIGIIGGCIGGVASLAAIITFIVNASKDKYNKGESDGGIRGDIKYMRNGFDDLRLDVKEINRKQDTLSERITRVEESAKSAHNRIDGLEKRVNKED